MRIIFVTTHLTSLGGAGKTIMDYANEFSKKGHKVTVLALKINKRNYFFNKNITLYEIGGFLPSSPFFWVNFINIKKKYLTILNNLNCDILVSSLFPTNSICSEVNKNKYSCHIYFCFEPFRLFHDKIYIKCAPLHLKLFSIIFRTFLKKIDIKGAKTADQIIYISKFIAKFGEQVYNREGFLHYIGISNRKEANYIYNKKMEYRARERNPSLFTLGLSHHMKGVKELMYIFREVLNKKPEIILKIGGWISKENKFKMKKLMNKLKIPPNQISLLGDLNSLELDYFYSNSSVTIYTAKNESYGLIPLESMVNGTPVIAFKNGGPSETILDGKTGFLIDDFNLNLFAKKVLEIIKDDNTYKEISKNGIVHVKNYFDHERSFKKLENLFLEFLH